MAYVELQNTSLRDDANLNFYLRFEGNSTAEVGGVSGTDTAITYSGANGKVGQGAGYNGTTSQIVYTNNAIFRPSGNFSVGAWAYVPSSIIGVSFDDIFASFQAITSVYSGYDIEVNSSGKAAFLTCKNTGNVEGTDFKTVTGATTVANDAYHLLVGVYNGSTLKIYVDGNEDGSVSWTNNPVYAASNLVTVGAKNSTQFGYSNPWHGNLDELFLYNRVLTATEISNLFNGTLGPSSLLTSGRKYMSSNTNFWG